MAFLPARKMWVQLAVVLAFLVATPLTVLGGLLIATSQTSIQTTVLRDQEQLAVRAASEIREIVKRPGDLLRSTASILGTLHADRWRQETALVELALNEEIFSRISLIGMDGMESVTSELGTPLADRSQDAAFRSASQGTFYMSDVRIAADHTPYVTMALPLKQFGKISGVLAAEVSLRGFWKVVDEIRIGRTGRAYVVSQRGTLIADEDKKRVLSNEDLSAVPAVRAALAGRTGSEEFVDTSGGRWLNAYAPIAGLGWGVVVKQSADEAYSFLRLMKLESKVLIVLSLLVAVLFSILLARILVNPIKLLAQKMRRVAQGDLDQRLAVERKDELGDLMAAFNRMAEKLKEARDSEKLAAIGKAAAAITHELKNSLVMAGTYIGLLPKRHGDKDFLEKFSRVMPQELESWKNMLQDISDYSRRSGFPLSTVDMNALIADFVLLVEHRLSQNHVRLDLDVPDDLPKIRGNEQKLKQVLMNLAINALDAMPDGGRLGLAARPAKGPSGRPAYLEISVEDSGKGIAEDKIPLVFEPFHTTKTNGLGLGLAICREIVELHGGRIQAQSQVGRGSTFTMILPAA